MSVKAANNLMTLSTQGKYHQYKDFNAHGDKSFCSL